LAITLSKITSPNAAIIPYRANSQDRSSPVLPKHGLITERIIGIGMAMIT